MRIFITDVQMGVINKNLNAVCSAFGAFIYEAFQTLLLRFLVRYLKVTRTEVTWLFSLHCLQPISLKFSNVYTEGANYRDIFFGGSLFQWDFIFADR